MRLTSVLLLLLACSPPPAPPPDSGMPMCGEAAKTPPNLMADPSVECDGGTAWSAQIGDVALAAGGHTGMYAIKGTASSTGGLQLGGRHGVELPAAGDRRLGAGADGDEPEGAGAGGDVAVPARADHQRAGRADD